MNRKSKLLKEIFQRDDAYKTLDTVNFWIDSCDTKASILLAFIGILLTIIFTSPVFEDIGDVFSSIFESNRCTLVCLVIISSILCFLGIISLLAVIVPRVIIVPQRKTSKKTSNASSFMFYGTISQIDYSSYKKQMSAMSNLRDPVMRDLLFQIHSASVICTKKITHLKFGVILFFVGFLLLGISVLLGRLG